jgi:hypothetical protein
MSIRVLYEESVKTVSRSLKERTLFMQTEAEKMVYRIKKVEDIARLAGRAVEKVLGETRSPLAEQAFRGALEHFNEDRMGDPIAIRQRTISSLEAAKELKDGVQKALAELMGIVEIYLQVPAVPRGDHDIPYAEELLTLVRVIQSVLAQRSEAEVCMNASEIDQILAQAQEQLALA